MTEETLRRHSRECGNPLPDVCEAMFYQRFLKLVLDSRLCGHDGVAFFQAIDDVP
uniref:Uncharacterized protein n=1 Tax=Conchiformibius kuhniae TaxID=211502 RepID=A0A8T9MX41_9NEIS|nr:hypothetical protein LVJ77_04545 [Conchiformibius kuhniae]